MIVTIVVATATHETLVIEGEAFTTQVRARPERFVVIAEEDGRRVALCSTHTREEAERVANSLTYEIAIADAQIEAEGATRQ